MTLYNYHFVHSFLDMRPAQSAFSFGTGAQRKALYHSISLAVVARFDTFFTFVRTVPRLEPSCVHTVCDIFIHTYTLS